ncbi:protein fem-1 homolog A [Aricia agestis]|uniref:protein fem-1 homolog A n=1 Tax=Aricia agestis TaxID=91739 RepID=UPI001C207EFC|nr:protein fem-1 homolog A [Aricia agestis]
MWEEGTSSPKGLPDSKQYDAVFNELMQECKHSAPGARLSARLRTALERMPPAARRAVCSRTRDGCAPLFVACRRGNVELVEYLVHVCAADLEQRGVYEVPHDRSTHSVTPLWCAAVAGRLPVLRALADAGAALDAASDSGSTPVRSACFMTHLDVVRLLLERGADLHRPNHNGGTCLINAVQSVPLCALLLDHGARPDHQDMQLKTALHYAVQEHRLETARLLLERGADPHLRSRAGDDALRTACLKGATQIVELLVSRVQYSAERVADAYELLGATQLDEFNDVHAALAAWRHATAIRHAHGQYIEKRNWEGLTEWSVGGTGAAALGGAREWRTPAELAAIAADVDALRAAALLVAVRVLGVQHKDTVFRLMYRGAAYADAFRYQRCIDLWMWALEIRIEKDSLLYSDTCQTASALTRLLLDARSGRLERAAGVPRPRDVLRAFRLLADALPAARAALRPRPVHRRQADNYDRALRCASHLLHLLAAAPAGAPADAAAVPPADVAAAVRALVAADVRSASTGDTLLHLCVSRLNVVRSTYFADESAGGVFPSAAAVRLLLRCGADPLARNEARSTALHVAAVPYNYTGALVAALLEAGAHLDTPNRFGDRAADLVLHNRAARLRPLRYVTLRCLAARALLAAHPAPLPPGVLPQELERFLDLHRP